MFLNVVRLQAQQGADRGFHIAGMVLILVCLGRCVPAMFRFFVLVE